MNEQEKKQEIVDAERVNEAIEMVAQNDLEAAEEILKTVVANTPANYDMTEEQEDGSLHIRFWNQEQFIYFITLMQASGHERNVTWVENAYGRARFYQGFLEVKRGRDQEALDYLEAGIALEPEQPFFYLEMGKALAHLREFEAALDAYEAVLARGLNVFPTARGMALRGKGFLLIEMGDLDQAEAYFWESLKVDPENSIALKELTYIENLRAGGQRAKTEMLQTNFGKSKVCSVCDQPMKEGRVVNEAGQLIYLCKDCEARVEARRSATTRLIAPEQSKKWWQFWKR